MKRKQYMVLICFAALACLNRQAQAQGRAENMVKVTAKMDSLTAGQWLYYGPSATFAQLKDSVKTTAGGFSLQIPMKPGEGDFYTLQIGNDPKARGAVIEQYLEPGELHIKAAGRGFNDKSDELSGSRFVQDQVAFQKSLKADSMSQFPGIISYLRRSARDWTLQHPSSNVGILGVIQIYFSLQQQFKSSPTMIPLWAQVQAACPVSAMAEIVSKLTPGAADNIPCKNILAMAGKGKPISKWDAHPWNGSKVTVTAEISGLAAGQWVYYGLKKTFGQQQDAVMTTAGGFRLQMPMKPGDGDSYSFQIGDNPQAAGASLDLYLEPGEVHIKSGGPLFGNNYILSGSQFASDQGAYQKNLNVDSVKQAAASGLKAFASYVAVKARQWTREHPASFNPGTLMLVDFYLGFLEQAYPQMARMVGQPAGPNDPVNADVYNSSIKEVNSQIIPLDSVMSLVMQLTPEARNNIPFRKIQDIAASYGNWKVNALNFTLSDVSGKQVSLKDFHGKYVLVDFWASWCVPCRNENPNVVKAYERYKNRNFTILGVSLDSKKESWLAAIQKDGLTWAQVSDLKGWQNAAAQTYHVLGIPANFLVDPDGKIIGRNLSGDDLEKKLDEVLPK